LSLNISAVEPDLLSADQSISKIEDMQNAKAHAGAAAVYAEELAIDMTGQVRLINHMVGT
jgi:hypothetical protein